MRENKQDLTKRRDDIAVAAMAAVMEVHMVADMEVDKVANKVVDMVANMFADIVAKKGTQFGKRKKGT